MWRKIGKDNATTVATIIARMEGPIAHETALSSISDPAISADAVLLRSAMFRGAMPADRVSGLDGSRTGARGYRKRPDTN